jgi:hypothetical protein
MLAKMDLLDDEIVFSDVGAWRFLGSLRIFSEAPLTRQTEA